MFSVDSACVMANNEESQGYQEATCIGPSRKLSTTPSVTPSNQTGANLAEIDTLLEMAETGHKPKSSGYVLNSG